MAKVVKSFLLISLVLLFAFTFVSFVPSGETAMAASPLWTEYASASLDGGGTIGQPYLIKNGADLARFGLMIDTANDDNKYNVGGANGTYYQLCQDIDLVGHNFAPISEFKANFDGNGYVVSNLIIKNNIGNTSNTGLFSATNNTAIIKNLGLHSVSIIGVNNVGGIVGHNGGQITQSFVNGNIKGTQFVGGIAGQSTGTIQYSYTLGEIIATTSHIGGIVGHLSASGSVQNSYTSTSIIASRSYMGAVIGMMSSSSVSTNTYYNNSLNSLQGIGGTSPTDGNTVGLNKYLISGLSALNTMKLNPNGAEKVFLANISNTDAILSSPTLSVFAQSALSLESSKTYLYGGFDISNAAAYGSELHPFLISTPTQFNNLSLAVSNNEHYDGKYFSLTKDLDFLNVPFSTVGSYSDTKYFNGIFDGKNFCIKNINYSAPTQSHVGVFGYNRGTIRNINLDESNSITGASFVGSLVGANEGNLVNIFSTAKVKGIDYVGGIAGRSSGFLQDILVTSSTIATSNGYGIIGEMINNPNIKNSWYLNSNNNYIHNQGGSVLTVDSNGTVTASKNNDGTIVFSGTASGGFTPEFRNKTESKIAEGATFTTDKSSSTSFTYFARFVKGISFSQDLSKYTVTGLNPSGYYYGQTVKLTLRLVDSYYLSNFGLSSAILSNKGNSRDIEAQFVMSDTTVSITPIVNSIGATAPMDTVYNKQSQVFSFELIGHDVSIAYSTGSAPVQAGTHTIMITISKNGVKIGYVALPFTIKKLDIKNYILDATSHLTKEFDNSLDSILLPTSVKFQENLDGSDVSLYVHAQYTKIDIGTCDVTLSFSLHGSAANNYNVPSDATVTGNILPKKLLISIEDKDLYKTYDTRMPYIGFYSATAIPSKAKLTYNFIFTSQTDASRPDNTMADSYTVSIILGGEDSIFYAAELKINYTYVIYPKEVKISFFGTANDDGSRLIYKNSDYSILAQYQDHLGITQNAIVTCYLASDESFSNPITVNYVNTYTAVATLTDTNYVVTADTKSITFDIIKSTQGEISISPFPSLITYGDTNLTLSLSAPGSGNGNVVYSVVSGFGVIENTNLVLTGGGDIVIVATKLADDNYLEAVSAEYKLTVAKKQLDITVNTLTFAYSDDIILDYTFQGYAYSDSGIPNGFVAPTINILLDSASLPLNQLTEFLDVGNYTIQLQNDASSDGYIFNYGTNSYTLVIDRKDITIIPDAITQIYGDSAAEITFLADGLKTTLSGNLSRSSINNTNVGVYDIIAGTLTNDNNTNYNITLSPSTYSITPRQLTITMKKAQKVFGEADPAPMFDVAGLQYSDLAPTTIFGSASRVIGEDAYITLTDTSRNYAYTVGTLTTTANYELNFVSNYLTIIQSIPTVSGNKSINVQYGDKLSSVKLTLNGNGISGNTTWADANIVPTYDNDGYMAIFKPLNNNYAAVNVKFEVTVVRRELTVDFIGAKNVTYTGKMHKHITYHINNSIQGDNLSDVLTFDSDDISVGNYKATLTISNVNYIIKGASFFEYTVNPAKLIISVEDINIDQNQTATPIFTYNSFVNNEDATVLKTLPQISIPKEAGNYSIAPFGASADNYAIEYKKANISVNKTLANNNANNINMVGRFDVDMVFGVQEIRSGEERTEFNKYGDSFNIYLENNGLNINGGTLQKLYKFNLSVGGQSYALKGTTTIKMEIASKFLSRASLNIAIFRKDGSIELVKDVSISGKEITFKIDGDIDSIAIVTPPDYTLPIIGGVSALLIILVFVLDAISEKLGIGRHKKKKQ